MSSIEKFLILVDDQKTFHHSLELAARILRLKNYRMFTTSEGMLEAINGDPNKIILIDWNLVGSSLQKEALIRYLRRSKPTAKIFVLSSSNDKREQESAHLAGASGWIVKTNLIRTLRDFFNEYDELTQFKVWR